MSAPIDRGPLHSYQITWASGHVETVQAHQVSYSGGAAQSLFSGGEPGPAIIRFHGEIDGHWRLVLHAREADVLVIRDVTNGEVLQ